MYFHNTFLVLNCTVLYRTLYNKSNYSRILTVLTYTKTDAWMASIITTYIFPYFFHGESFSELRQYFSRLGDEKCRKKSCRASGKVREAGIRKKSTFFKEENSDKNIRTVSVARH